MMEVLEMDADRIARWMEQYHCEKQGCMIPLPGTDHDYLTIFEQPLIGYADAADELFTKYKQVGVIGPWFRSPEEWLPEAKTVISMFFPFTEQVRVSNRAHASLPSQEWLCGRYEGQNFIAALLDDMCAWLESQGVKACAPARDCRFQAIKGGKGIDGYAEINAETYGSNWSERHAAFACGLGTFGLSKGLITEKGIAGRFASVIIDAPMTLTARPYQDVYEYCIKCGACARRCPVQAITVETGKKHPPCHAYVDKMLKMYQPRYGCGKCQTAVPCENGIPKRK